MKIKNFKGYFFIMPSLIGFSMLYVIPFLLGLRYSVSRSGFDDTFVGFTNYRNIINSLSFRLALKNNLIFLFAGLTIIIVLSFVLALIIHEINAPKILKLCIVLPIAIPSATVAGYFREVFATGANNLMDSEFAMIGVILIFLWRSTGYNLIIYLAALSQLDKSVIEASEIDGANYLEKLRHVIIPLVTPATFFVSIISIINSFKIYKDLYILQGNYPNPKIYMLQHYMNNKFRDLEYEKLTSAAYLFAIFIFIIALMFYYMDRRYIKKIGEN
ncbi:carbohydrate ABC transporter permease [Alkaliphilus peptidifermentans]|uniref:Multiple sugar transport system permease protein n=1 Tax=Alkaliphilus peptidifermentans DSM 18978 TaxID=1120976 RepID=A0A1G5BLD2_9FIRM|nr:sugar ABC transporter permease [Alkaliphilus peptidifermentans]SCX90927.1 multiple sugar transport system permease protein [Alkaliphilus peptidifermentans DSM 18978]